MPAIASLEELNMVRRDFRSMFLVVTPYDLRLTIYGQLEMAQDRLEECLQAVAGGKNPRAIKR